MDAKVLTARAKPVSLPNATTIDRYQIVASIAANLEQFVADRYDLDLAPLASSLGLSVADFQSNDKRVSLDRICRLFDLLAIASGDNDFGLGYAGAIEFGSTGYFGYGQKNAPTLGDLFNFNTRFMSLVCDITYLSLEIDAEYCRYHWSLPPMITTKSQFTLASSAMLVRLIRENFDSNWSPVEVWFDFPRVNSSSALGNSICPRVTFDESGCAIVIHTESLVLKNMHGDERLYRLIYESCESQLLRRQKSTSLLDAVMNEICDSLSDPGLSLARTARRLGTSDRSLQRYLAAQKQSFSELCDQARRELSDSLLATTDLPLYEIASRLGFSSTSAYTRTARRWYGVPPTEVRKRDRGAG